MRGVAVGRTTAVNNLRELWKKNSNLPCIPAFAVLAAAAAAAVVAPHFVALQPMPLAELLSLQALVPPTPPRGGSAAVPPCHRLALLLLQQILLQQILVGVRLTLWHSVMTTRLLHLGLPLPRPKTKPNV
jgi:hypothetical protein